MQIVLYQPQIPQNAGNIVRTCAVTGSSLTMVKPLGFSTQDRWLKRAGLDYWEGVSVELIDDLQGMLKATGSNFYFFSSKSTKPYTEIAYGRDDLLIFGSETSGLSERFLELWPERFYTIPMLPEKRCLNLSNAVAVVTYEAWRQQGFALPS